MNNPWIKISDRAPTPADFGPLKAVEICWLRGGNDSRCVLYIYSSLHVYREYTHWRTVDLPPPPAKELTQSDWDLKQAFEHSNTAIGLSTDNSWAPIIVKAHLAGIYAERKAIKKIMMEVRDENNHPTKEAPRILLTRLNEQGTPP